MKWMERLGAALWRIIVAGACCIPAATAMAQTVVVDNSDPGFTILYGEWSAGAYGNPYGDDYNWALTTGYGADPAEVEWRPALPAAGVYQVATWYVEGANRANDAAFAVHHADGVAPLEVNQQINGETWFNLGTFGFEAGTAGFVTLHNDANPSVVIADAVRFSRASGNAEFRGFWADAFHVGFKSQADIDDMVARALIGNYNAIVPEVLAYQDTGGSAHGAYWDSAIVPKANDISGNFDPLEYMVARAHEAGLEVHPWLVAFRVSTSWPPAGNATLTAHPEWLMVVRDDMGGGPATVSGKYTLDPGSPDVQEYLMSIVRELVTNYEIDGVHWDYIRYTTDEAGYPAYTWYDRSGLARFQEITGYAGTPPVDYGPWDDFRRREITEVVRRAQVEMATIRSNPRQPLRHSAALITWGNAPSDFEDTSAWGLFQNWREWMEEGYLDAGIPMTYYDYDVYPSWYRNWVDQEMQWRYERHMVVGPGIYLNSFANSVIEIEYAQNAGADGICTYSYASTSGSRDWDWYPYVAGTAFAEPAAPPPMTWRDPATATEGCVYGRVTDGETGEPIDDATIALNGFPMVQTDGNGFYVITRLLADPGGTPIPLSASDPDYPEDAYRPAVLVERAGYTEANLALGLWLPGDYDVDGDVDFDDFTRFAPGMTSPDSGPPPAGCDLFDFDADNDVDLADFRVFQESCGG